MAINYEIFVKEMVLEQKKLEIVKMFLLSLKENFQQKQLLWIIITMRQRLIWITDKRMENLIKV